MSENEPRPPDPQHGAASAVAAVFGLAGSVAASVTWYQFEAEYKQNAETSLDGFLYGALAFGAASVALVWIFRKFYRRHLGSPGVFAASVLILPLFFLCVGAPAIARWLMSLFGES